MEIAGLPVHALVVHAAVVLIPLSSLLVIAFAVLPGWRWLTRWPTAIAAVTAFALAWVARISGTSFKEALTTANPDIPELIQTHQSRGNLLSWLVIPFAVIVLVGCWSMAGSTALASGKGSRVSRVPALEKVMPAVLVVASLVVMAMTVAVGDAGARAVWG